MVFMKQHFAIFSVILAAILFAGCAASSSGKVEIKQRITNEQAVSAVRKYCLAASPELDDIVNAGQYPVYWELESDEENMIVVLFRSYTGALIRYHIDPVSGDTYTTEFIPGVSSAEERTGENLNMRDYLD